MLTTYHPPKPHRDHNCWVLSKLFIAKAKWNQLYWKSYSNSTPPQNCSIFFFNNLFVHVIISKIWLAACIFRTARWKIMQELCDYTQYHIRIILVANSNLAIIQTSLIKSCLIVIQHSTLFERRLILSYVCFSKIYYHRERNYNAGTGNFVYVGECCFIWVLSLILRIRV